MRTLTIAVAGLIAGTAAMAVEPPVRKDAPSKAGFPKFKVQELATDLTVGYAVVLADVNNDTKPDIVVVDSRRVIWYENPTWKVRTIIGAKTKPDNVCITALDIDGGGDIEFVLGAGWKPSDTQTPGTLQWLKRGKTLDEEWTVHPIPCDEPTVHRVRAADMNWDGKPEIVMAPLHGWECTSKGNYTDGRPARITMYSIPLNPTDPKAWKPQVISERLHVIHNIWAPPLSQDRKAAGVLAASYEGVFGIGPLPGSNGKNWETNRLAEGDQRNRNGSRGASELNRGYFLPPRLRGSGGIGAGNMIATIEPWHGNQVVVYLTVHESHPRQRVVVDSNLRWGHAIWCVDLDGDKVDELIVGVRDDPNPKLGDKFTERRGVRLYRCTDGRGEKWDRHILEDGGVAVEDLAVGDLNGDGKPDIVAVGRQTRNVRVYWNQGK